MPELSDLTAVRITWPILKAMPNGDDGSLFHAGIASDETLDLQNEVLPTALLAKSFDYLRTHGKFVWDHHSDDIGDILGVAHVDPAEARELFDVDITKSGTAVWGTVYPLVDPVLASEDLKTAHHRMRAGARLGYSLDGVAVRKSNGDLVSMAITKVAITGQPVNPATTCKVIAKSLSAAMEHVQVSDRDLPEVVERLERGPDVLIECQSAGGATVESTDLRISKALYGELVRIAFGGRRERLPAMGKLREALKGCG